MYIAVQTRTSGIATIMHLSAPSSDENSIQYAYFRHSPAISIPARADLGNNKEGTHALFCIKPHPLNTSCKATEIKK